MSDSEHRVHLDVEKNSRERLRVSTSTWKGQPRVHIRAWYADKDGALQPGKGIALKVEQIPEVIEALRKAAEG